jgi:hypothetical protein|tara:strand:- start:1581 stop:1874 length:294 start_codon:yes stop_codon:yes gene_type:complete
MKNDSSDYHKDCVDVYNYEQLNKGINEYFANNVFIENEESQNKRSFESLVSVTFANRSKLIEIVYHERAERDDKEQQDYLADVKEKYKLSDEKENSQ